MDLHKDINNKVQLTTYLMSSPVDNIRLVRVISVKRRMLTEVYHVVILIMYFENVNVWDTNRLP